MVWSTFGLDGDRLLESQDVGDHVIAVLARLRNDKGAIHKIVERIAGLARAERETRKMPIEVDIREHEVIGPLIREAEQKGELTILRRQIEKRFGGLPGWARERPAAMSIPELEDLSERVLDAKSLEELLK
jgi:hypothetical protein